LDLSSRCLPSSPMPSWISAGAFSVSADDAEERTPMFRVLILLFWVSLIVGTLAAHSGVANWAVTLAALYFTARWWAGRRRVARRSEPQRTGSGGRANDHTSGTTGGGRRPSHGRDRRDEHPQPVVATAA